MAVTPQTNGYRLCIVVGGHKDDSSPGTSKGLFLTKVADPATMAPSFNHKEMKFIPNAVPVSQKALEETPIPPEPGSIVMCSVGGRSMGDPSDAIALSLINGMNAPGPSPGNDPLNNAMSHLRAAMYKIGKNRPPKYTEKMERGALVRKVENELGEWFHDLTKGLPVHAAIQELSGQFLPGLKQVETAKEQFGNILNSSAIQQLAGNFMNIQKLFETMTKSQMKKIRKNMPEEVQIALDSFITLLQEGENGGFMITTGAAHEETFRQNAIELLSQVTSTEELFAAISQLRSDDTLKGLDKLEEIILKANTSYGEIEFNVDYEGNIKQTQQTKDMLENAIKSLTGVMSSSMGGAPGKEMFGEANKIMSEIIGRIPQGKRQEVLMNTLRNAIKNFHTQAHDDMNKGRNPILDGIFG